MTSGRKSHYMVIHNDNLQDFERLDKQEVNFLPFKCLNQFCDKKFKTYIAALRHCQSVTKRVRQSISMVRNNGNNSFIVNA